MSLLLVHWWLCSYSCLQEIISLINVQVHWWILHCLQIIFESSFVNFTRAWRQHSEGLLMLHMGEGLLEIFGTTSANELLEQLIIVHWEFLENVGWINCGHHKTRPAEASLTLYFPNRILLICGNVNCRFAFLSAINEDNDELEGDSVNKAKGWVAHMWPIGSKPVVSREIQFKDIEQKP